LINSMNLMNALEDEDGEKMEALKPSETFNPIVQHFYECLHTRVLHPNDELPKIDENITQTCLPQLAKDSFYQTMLQKSKESIEIFCKEFPLKKIEEKTKEKKRFWFAMDKSEEITLEEYENPTKKVKPNEITNESREMELIQEKIDLDILSSKTKSVGTKDPIKDFKEMFQRKDVDLVDKAIDEMGKVVFKLIQDSIEDQYYEKSLNCIKELRKGCIDEEEIEKFNEFIRKVKTTYSGGRKNDFWELIQKEKISLITHSESGGSEVTDKESEKFLNEKEEVQESIDEEPIVEEDDLFGDLE
jgi:ATP-dependent DNA helicase 2 subunit 2